MRAASLLIVFVLAKLAVVWGHTVPLSIWSPAAYLWQDVLVVLLFAALDSLASRARLTAWAVRMLYWALVIYTAINIPVGRVLCTPLTWPMLHAARGPLADSVLFYATWKHTLMVLLTLAAAAILPSLLRNIPRKFLALAAAGCVPIVALGPTASARVDTLGLHRSAFVTLISGGSQQYFPPARGDWRRSRFHPGPTEDLSSLRGIAKDRNIILVSLESTAAQYLSLYGGRHKLMPNLDLLSRNGVVFENAYAVYPESIKGLFTVLCSAYPAFDSRPENCYTMPCRSVAAALADSGYRTGLFHSGRFEYLGMESIVRNRGYHTLEDAGDIGGNRNSSFGIDEPSTVARILSWIDSLPRQQFFLTYLPIAGHHPYETPERGPFVEREEFDRYRNALHYGDRSLGVLMQGLRERGLQERTVWIILGDHGEAFGQHEGNYGHTFYLYDENVRVPLVVAAPGSIQRQVRVKKIVSLVDTAPTILELAGIAAPEDYQGRSMLDTEPRMALFFTDYSRAMFGLRDGPWKFVYELNPGRSRMFDLDRDPHERTNVSSRESERAAWYAQVVMSRGREKTPGRHGLLQDRDP